LLFFVQLAANATIASSTLSDAHGFLGNSRNMRNFVIEFALAIRDSKVLKHNQTNPVYSTILIACCVAGREGHALIGR
jgi:hypothetical protein